MNKPVLTTDLISHLTDARARTLELVRGLDDAQLKGTPLDIVNPLLWEIGHVAWFYEHFVLRSLGDTATYLDASDTFYNSSAVPHHTRWDLPLPELAGTLDYMARIHDAMISRLRGGFEDAAGLYFLAIYHEDMHCEAFTYERQTLGYPAPVFQTLEAGPPADADAGPLDGDVTVAGGTFSLGATANAAFVFDNEAWAHPVTIAPFQIARAPVTNSQFLAFMGEGGYRRREFWSDKGWNWRKAAQARHPVYWAEQQAGWAERSFDRMIALRPYRPVIHVNFHEAEAWCNWAGRRLPSEAEWEVAAAGAEPRKRNYPWGEAAPSPRHANLDGHVLGTVDVAAHPEGDSACGCRQMLGNVWEWTASDFDPYPGFRPGVYAEYSAPWFGSRKVLRGGAWATRGRMVTNTYRNFFTPERRDVLAGFRTCAR
jgi:iron(II)-dependent oxidoreductase